MHVAAMAAGAWLAARYLPSLTRRLRGRPRPLYLSLAYKGLLLLWAWRPFHLEANAAAIRAQLAPHRLVPLVASDRCGGVGPLKALAERHAPVTGPAMHSSASPCRFPLPVISL